MKPFNRRNFLKTGAIGVAGFASLQNTKAGDSLKLDESDSQIIKRNLGNTGIEVPIVGMGVGSCDSAAVIKGALKLGITYFDTAYVYQKGNSEKLLGDVLKDYPRDSYYISTKVTTKETKEEFLEKFNTSLERLQMEYVDILCLHAIKSREALLNPEMLEALKIAKESGKAKRIAVSTHKNEPEVIQAAIDSEFYEIVITSVNFKQEHSLLLKEKLELANQKGLGIIAMKVMAGGYLDKEKLNPVNHNAALKWVLQNKNVHTSIPSMVNLEQLMQNSTLLTDIEMTEEEKNDLVIAQQQVGIYCDGCSECTKDCIKQLPIPDLMRAYMYTYGYQETSKAKELISSLNMEDNPCKSCETCSTHCVKGFNIAEKISDVNRLMSVPDEFLT